MTAETIPYEHAERQSRRIRYAVSEKITGGREWPEPPDDAAYQGLAGEIVRTIDPHTEADPIAILAQFLIAFGSAVGRGPHFVAEADRHDTNLFAVFVGETAKGRKGSSWGQARRVVEMADQEWLGRVKSGLSSGEGLIWEVRDPIEKQEPIKEKWRVVGYQTVVEDPGVADKRLLVFEGEFASPLRVSTREGNVLSPVLRNAWDSRNLSTLTKNNPAKATGAHISIVGHITRDELLRHFDNTEIANGFGNRFLWFCIRRSKELPDGGSLNGDDLIPLAGAVREALEFSRTVQLMQRDEDARKIWHRVYGDLSDGKPGLLGAVTARAEAQVMRLALIYALLDCSPVIKAVHLHAALALWEYVEASVEYIFGDRLGDPVVDTVLDALRQTPAGMTRTDISNHLGRHYPASRIQTGLNALLRTGKAHRATETTGGRPIERWFAVDDRGT